MKIPEQNLAFKVSKTYIYLSKMNEIGLYLPKSHNNLYDDDRSSGEVTSEN